MVTTVVVPPDRAGSRPGGGDEVERVLITRTIVDAIGSFVRDPARLELVNWGGGPSSRLVDTQVIDEAREQGHGISGIFTIVEPVDLDLYRAFLPPSLTMPEHPAVGLAGVDFNRGNPATRYQEGWITVKARCPDGREAWLVVSMPVTRMSTCYAGVAFGFPKYVADQMTISETFVEARYNGAVRFSLELSPGTVPNEAALRAQGIFSVGNALTVHPTRDGGCLVNWFQRDRGGARRWEGEVFEWTPGTVRAHLQPGDPWAGLIADGSESPGIYQRVFETGASDFVCEKLGGRA